MKKNIFFLFMVTYSFNIWAQYNTSNFVTKTCRIIQTNKSRDPGAIEIRLNNKELAVTVLNRPTYYPNLNFNGTFKAVLNKRNENIIENGNLVFLGYVGGNGPDKISVGTSLLNSSSYGLVYFSFAKNTYSTSADSVVFECN